MDDRHQATNPKNIPRKFQARQSRLGAVTVPLKVPANVVADFEFGPPVDLLPRQPAVADEPAVVRFHNPQPKTVASVIRLVPLDPSQCFVPRFGRWVVPHYCGIAEHRAHYLEIGERHLAKAEAGCRAGEHPRSLAAAGPCLHHLL